MGEHGENLPSFFTNQFFSTLLQKNNSKRINVLTFNAVPAVEAGNNFCCTVYRVRVEYEVDHEITATSLIIKTPLAEGKAREVVVQLGMIEKECMIYNELLPLMEGALTSKIMPKHYPSTQPDTVILEDLMDQGYIMCDRLEQLDFDHCNMFMKTIAIFHATSLYINKRNPELIERVGKEAIYKVEPKENFRKYFKDSTSTFATILEEWGEFDDFVDLYRNKGEQLLDKVIAAHNTKKHLRVLNHGDSWTNNLLFKHDESGNVIDLKLIDFQICKFSSPALDLILFTLSSAQEDVYDRRLPELYATYLESFNTTLEFFGSDERLTVDILQDELKFAECVSLSLLISLIPLVLNEVDNAMDMAKVVDAVEDLENECESNSYIRAFRGKKFKAITKKILRKLREQNFLLYFL